MAIACSVPPEIHTGTVKQLAGEVVELGFAESISLDTVRQRLEKRTQAVEGEGVAHSLNAEPKIFKTPVR